MRKWPKREDGVTDIDDIDLMWDNPERMHGRRQDVLDMI